MPRVEYTQSTGLVQKQTLKDSSGNLLPELNLQGALFGHRSKIKSVTGATQLLASETGSTILITPGNADYAITLPDLEAKFYDEGVKFTFILAKSLDNGQPDNNNITINQADINDDFKGTIQNGNGGSSSANNHATITFAKAVGGGGGDVRALEGDRIEIVSTSSREWFVSGQCQKPSAVVFA